MAIGVKIGFDKHVTREKRYLDRFFAIASLAGNGYFGEIDFHRFAQQAFINDIFMAAFSVQYIPQPPKFRVSHLFSFKISLV
jgi:hypothetical protein